MGCGGAMNSHAANQNLYGGKTMTVIEGHSNTQSTNHADQRESLLGCGIDRLEWTVLADEDVIRRASDLAQCRIRDGDPRFINAEKRGYVARFADGDLEILVPQVYNDHWGLKVTARSVWCLRNDLHEYEQIVAAVLYREFSMIGSRFRTHLKRVDIRYDYSNLRPELRTDEIITRAKSTTLEYDGERISGVQLGQSAVVLRFYDKVLEAKAQGTTAVWQEAWNEFDGEVWRLEYQFRQRFLAEYNVSTVGQFLERARDMHLYMLKWACFAHVAPRKGMYRERVWWWLLSVCLLWTNQWFLSNFPRSR